MREDRTSTGILSFPEILSILCMPEPGLNA